MLFIFVCFAFGCSSSTSNPTGERQGDLDATFNAPDGYALYGEWNKDSHMGTALQQGDKIVVVGNTYHNDFSLQNGCDTMIQAGLPRTDICHEKMNQDRRAQEHNRTNGSLKSKGPDHAYGRMRNQL